MFGGITVDISLSEIERAAERLKPILHHTELDLSSTFSGMTDAKIYLKCENRQKTGSFKIRGASNRIAAMVENGNIRPVVASSAGNHAQGVAYAASRFNIPATIVMPKAAPITRYPAMTGSVACSTARQVGRNFSFIKTSHCDCYLYKDVYI